MSSAIIRTRRAGATSDEAVSPSNPLAVELPATTVTPTTFTATGEVRNSRAILHWVTASNGHATEITEVELNDSTDDSGADRWGCYLSDNAGGKNTVHAEFDPPIEFVDGIFLDLTNATTVVITLGLE